MTMTVKRSGKHELVIKVKLGTRPAQSSPQGGG